MCALTARFLAYLYTNQCLRVRWNGCNSDSFPTSNGVKQGGILSPILFCIYMDELLHRLKASKVGCYIGDTFYGGLGYADDLYLLAPNRRSTCILLNICESFGKEYCVKFNSTKSLLILFNNRNNYVNMTPLNLNGEVIHVQEKATHLGHTVGNDECNKIAISTGISNMIWRSNYVMSKFGFCNAEVRSYMFRTYCTSYYGCSLWRLDSKYINRFHSCWRKCVRKMWNIPARTHCRFLKHLFGGPDIATELLCRFMSFYYSAINSNNPCIYMCAILCQSSNTSVAINRRILLGRLRDDGSIFETNLTKQTIKKTLLHKVTTDNCNNECKAMGTLIKELCSIRDYGMTCDLDSQDILDLLNEVCLN